MEDLPHFLPHRCVVHIDESGVKHKGENKLPPVTTTTTDGQILAPNSDGELMPTGDVLKLLSKAGLTPEIEPVADKYEREIAMLSYQPEIFIGRTVYKGFEDGNVSVASWPM